LIVAVEALAAILAEKQVAIEAPVFPLAVDAAEASAAAWA
jgi:hypothetical protein